MAHGRTARLRLREADNRRESWVTGRSGSIWPMATGRNEADVRGSYGLTMLRRAQFCRSGGTGSAVWKRGKRVFRQRIRTRPSAQRCLRALSSARRRSPNVEQAGRSRPARRRDGGERAGVCRGRGFPRVSVRGAWAAWARAETDAWFPRLPSGGRRQGEGFGHDRFGGAEHRGEQGAGVELALAGGAHDAGQDLPGVGSAPGAVAAADLAGDHRGADGVFGPPVGGVEGRVAQEEEHGLEFAGQVPGEALGGGQRRRGVDQPAEPGFEPSAG